MFEKHSFTHTVVIFQFSVFVMIKTVKNIYGYLDNHCNLIIRVSPHCMVDYLLMSLMICILLQYS